MYGRVHKGYTAYSLLYDYNRGLGTLVSTGILRTKLSKILKNDMPLYTLLISVFLYNYMWS